jgi:putative ubiquitin-RnfH superfamily antitoxin RatB of RatAB toxin-antitoxin module
LQCLAILVLGAIHEKNDEFQSVPIALQIGVFSRFADQRRRPALRLEDRLDCRRIFCIDEFCVRRRGRESERRSHRQHGPKRI